MRVHGRQLIIVKGDCEYSGTKKIISREDCLSGITSRNDCSGMYKSFRLYRGGAFYY